MTALSAPLVRALRNLADKAAGRPVDWINIADARALTELGLAVRTRQGWSITGAGETRLADETQSERRASGEVTRFTLARPHNSAGLRPVQEE